MFLQNFDYELTQPSQILYINETERFCILFMSAEYEAVTWTTCLSKGMPSWKLSA